MNAPRSAAPNIAALFPGQGSHAVGMGSDLTAAFPQAEAVYAEAEATLPGLRPLIEQGPLEDLTLTANQQPALVAASVAAYRAWQAQTGLTPAFAAGHSLGEYSALVAAGALGLADALRLTRRRGELMQEAVPVGVGAMSAVMGDPDVVREVCESTPGIVQPANFNAPTQTVISGEKAAVDAAAAELKARGLKAIPLKVSAPFHCALMQPAQDALTPALQTTVFSPFAFPVYPNVTAGANCDPAALPELLARQITGSVRWVETILALAAAGADVFIEFGPGTVLTGLVKRILPDARTVNVGTAERVGSFQL
ncbi:ACP S-malonyltransferase [Deinococcus metallilatus]|uniref:Malonyl CoA-acyl carrier protein transacylase n=1 Tax=Deinococcus metallilatus TaxID=1211322 RepID=A0AAJ5F307_9DEIO|nr:ACP S-malonyltransferase [Deinococcus metallilatus]MBB5295430.1 [acyl-carrier-protein] S-malonyltransferase [Deinococcus metallilatus]QBY08046.1 ACP S-malonyltransferase [Deinococcus metallilatus]RXJ12939.1 [acyl-carrier-protein] S-malonyltransferase [Deinococcus metallilatus]TLK27139.1 ACP S-malonyltransferase [Deinococcus metallilatus]GMA16107.1 malonyl CoA-acyl carrier protein transacylase [Deinococcus metallilatus]